MPYWDEQQKRFVTGSGPTGPSMPDGLSITEQLRWKQRAENQQQLQEEQQKAQKSLAGKPLFANSPGQAIGELGKIVANAGIGLATDYVDVGLGLADLARAGVSGATGSKRGDALYFNGNEVFNDSNNPLTQARRNAFKTDTEAGQMASNIVRIGVGLLALPKFALAGIAKPAKFIGGIAKVGETVEGIGNIANKVGSSFNKATKANQTVGVLDALRAIQPAVKSSAGSKVIDRAIRSDYLLSTADDINKAIAGTTDSFKAAQLQGVKAWWENTELAAKGLFRKPSARTIKTVGQAMAWDAFVAFNVAGEGDSSMDETFGDFLSGTNNRWANALGAPTTTYAEDSALTLKFKQMAEGLVMGGIMESAMNYRRIWKYADNFRKASPTEQARILNVFERRAQEFGDGIAKQYGPFEANLPQQGPNFFGGDPWKAQPATGQSQASLLGQLVDQVGQSRQAQQQALLAPGIGTQYDSAIGPEYGVVADAASPVQQRLAQMEGLASPVTINDDPMYQQWLASRAPAGDLIPQTREPGLVAKQFADLPKQPAPAGPDDLAAYKQWLEENAKGNEQMRPEVQAALRRMEGIGELAVRTPPGQLANIPPASAGQAQLPGQQIAGQLPGGAQPALPPAAGQIGQPGAAPAGLLGAGGPPARIGAVVPADVSLLPRPNEPVVTPQTIRNAFERDAYNAWKESRDLTYIEGPNGSMQRITDNVKQLMPRTRVDTLEYLRTFPPKLNPIGMQPAADSIWTNFIQERALREGWGKVDPETLQMSFNRKAALDLDKGDLEIKQAEALDEVRALNQFNELEIDKAATGDAYSQEARAAENQYGTAIDQTQTNQLAQAELEGKAMSVARQADQLDNSEAQRLSNVAMPADIGGKLSDEQVVREMLGGNLDELAAAPLVERADTGRGWQVFNSNGEPIGRSPTKKGADILAKNEQQAQRQALLARARQMEADAADEAMNGQIGDALLDSDISGTVKITGSQAKAVSGIDSKLDELLAAVGEKGGKVDMSQSEMSRLAKVIDQVLQEGSAKGSQKLALKNLSSRLDTDAKLLEPQARQQRTVDQLTRDVINDLDNGKHCQHL
jgi:hypothetical protein